VTAGAYRRKFNIPEVALL